MLASLKNFARYLLGLFGQKIRDERTGEPLGRALVLPFAGNITVVGLPHAVRPVFLPESTTRYTKHRIGFATHELPDYPSLQAHGVEVLPEQILWAVLVHQPPGVIAELVRYWEALGYSRGSMLLVHAGNRADFDAVDFTNKVFVEDADVRTRFHPLEKQSYGGVLREVAAWLATKNGADFEAVTLVEYDHVPLVADWGSRLCVRLKEEQADVLCHHLVRVDGTNAAHYLYELSEPRFAGLWKSFSRREEKGVFFNAVMTGSVWRRAALEAVAACREPFPVYLELYLPSLAHHLGFRVRPHGEQDRYVQVVPMKEPFSSKWREEGAWSLHQVKSLSASF